MKPGVPLDVFVEGVSKSVLKGNAVFKNVQAMVFMDLAKQVYQGTPVDTGRARNNWIPSVGAPSRKVVQGGTGGLMTGEGMTAEEEGRVKAVLKSLHALPLGRVVYLSNSLPYIVRLEHGYSKKAPQGMVRMALATVRTKLGAGVYQRMARIFNVGYE